MTTSKMVMQEHQDGYIDDDTHGYALHTMHYAIILMITNRVGAAMYQKTFTATSASANLIWQNPQNVEQNPN